MNEPTDIDKLIEGFRLRATQVEELSRDIQATEVPKPEDPSLLIEGVAENLSKMREAAGLPSHGRGDVEKQIKRRQRFG